MSGAGDKNNDIETNSEWSCSGWDLKRWEVRGWGGGGERGVVKRTDASQNDCTEQDERMYEEFIIYSEPLIIIFTYIVQIIISGKQT